MEVPIRIWHLTSTLCFSYFAASKALEEQGGIDSGGYWLLLIKQSLEQDEIRHLLVTIAAQLRSGRDIVRATESRSDDEISGRATGQICQPVAAIAQDLSFKDACDKILHATTLSFETVETNPREKWINYYLLPRLHLSGSRHIKGQLIEWKANLDVNAFLRAATEAAQIDWRPLTAEQKRQNRMLELVIKKRDDESRVATLSSHD